MPNNIGADFLRKSFLKKLPVIDTAHTASQHFYSFEGYTFPSVSAPLSWWKKAELADWALKTQEEYILHNWKDFNSVSIYQHLGKMKNVSHSIREQAAKIGTAVHGYREKIIENYWQTGEWSWEPTDDLGAQVINGVNQFLDFVNETKYEPILCEARLVDTKLGVGGSLDDIGLLDNKLVLIDVKTSNYTDHYTYWLQISKYWDMFRKHTGVKKLKPYLLHLPKKPGQKYSLTEINDPKKYAKQYDELFKIWQNKDSFKPERIKNIIL